MAYFETVMILNPTKGEKELKKEIQAYEKYIQTFSKTKKVKTDDMGEKTLAYEIKKYITGYYAVFLYQAKPIDVENLERKFRIDDEVLKFISIKSNEDRRSRIRRLYSRRRK